MSRNINFNVTVKKGNDMNGLVEVTFTPEIRPMVRFPITNCVYGSDSFDGSFGMQRQGFNTESYNSIPKSLGVGATVLGGNSSQRFGTASQIIEDKERRQIKRIRLVVDVNAQPFVSIKTRGRDISMDDEIPPQIGKTLAFSHSNLCGVNPCGKSINRGSYWLW
jgi:hypothetical protein